jgi:copper chaperone
MISFEVNDMTCGHCVSTITKALKTADRALRNLSAALKSKKER